MRLSLSMLLALGALCLVGCGSNAPCVDEENDELSFCEFEVQGEPEPRIYCPGEHWASEDGCFSYACLDEGEVRPSEDRCAVE